MPCRDIDAADVFGNSCLLITTSTLLEPGNFTYSWLQGILSIQSPSTSPFTTSVLPTLSVLGAPIWPNDDRRKKIQSQCKFTKTEKQNAVEIIISNHNVANHAPFHAALFKYKRWRLTGDIYPRHVTNAISLIII
jgi:hypothetical protein